MRNDVLKCAIPISPACDGLRIRWNHLESGKGCILPIDGTKENRNDHRAALIVACDSSFHFGAIAILRGHKVGANQEQDNISALEMPLQFSFPFHTCVNVSITPDPDLAQVF